MSTHAVQTGARAQADATSRGAERVAAALCTLLGALFMMWGTTWDIQWHVLVGRDSFWIPPHLVLYAGLMVIVLSVAVSILRETVTPAAGGISLLGLRAGTGIWISAAGAVTMLLAAPFDDWWHRTFGLDVTLWSPPHLMGIAGAAIIIFGALAGLGLEVRRGALTSRASGWAWVGMIIGFGQFMGPFSLAIQPATSLSFLAVTQNPLLFPLLAALAIPPVLAAARAATGRRWGAVTTVLIAVALAIIANRFAALGFRVMFAGTFPGLGARIARGLTLLRLLPVLPALVLDLVSGIPGHSRWRQALGAAVWAAMLMVEIILVQVRIGRSVPAVRALAVLPVMALFAIISSAVGDWAGTRISAQRR